MRNVPTHDPSFKNWREHMVEETCRFIEWGLAHPEQVHWIPQHPVGAGGFPERVKAAFWTLFQQQNDGPP
jgi:hypothetical protein